MQNCPRLKAFRKAGFVATVSVLALYVCPASLMSAQWGTIPNMPKAQARSPGTESARGRRIIGAM
jgi:hypothetical protein